MFFISCLKSFSQIVNISDGSNSSNIVTPGGVTNHIGGANVTTINGGKISTGVITSTGYTLLNADTLASGSFMGAGTIFNLDNGSLRSKNFYITSAGAAVFRGNITADSGEIGGWSINSTSLSKNGITLNSATPEISYVGGAYANFKISTGYINDVASSSDTIINTTYIGDGGQLWMGNRDIGGNLKNYIRFDSQPGYTRAIFYDDGSSTVGYTDELVSIHKVTDSNSAALRITAGGVAISSVGSSNGGYALQGSGDAYFSGTVTWGSSDKRLKTNVKNIDNPLEKISKINGIYFNWNELAKELTDKDTDKREVGFIAQEVQEVMPEIIARAGFDVANPTGANYLTIQYEKIVPLLVECIKELKKEIDQLKNK